MFRSDRDFSQISLHRGKSLWFCSLSLLHFWALSAVPRVVVWVRQHGPSLHLAGVPDSSAHPHDGRWVAPGPTQTRMTQHYACNGKGSNPLGGPTDHDEMIDLGGEEINGEGEENTVSETRAGGNRERDKHENIHELKELEKE